MHKWSIKPDLKAINKGWATCFKLNSSNLKLRNKKRRFNSIEIDMLIFILINEIVIQHENKIISTT